MSQTFKQYEQAGGAAFPVMDGAAADGITVRDYFAAKAMEALLVRGWVGEDAAYKPKHYAEGSDADPNYDDGAVGCLTLARDAYGIADAMLVARTKQPETP